MSDYYNEHDPFAAAWLRELIAAGEIPAGDVDERSIEDVVPSDLVGYRHCHFFAGIGGWARAMRFADWPDDLPLWTGSAPCQPFSAAGQGAGFADERHLWPAFYWLIRQCRPRYVCGEQVASGDALRWWDLVATDLEGAGYACTAVDLPAASVGAPHKRSRLFWLANAVSAGRAEGWPIAGLGSVAISGASSVVVADAEHTGHDRPRGAASEPDCDQHRQRLLDGDCRACRVADTDGGHTSAAREQRSGQHGLRTASGHAHGAAGLAECADHAISMADTSDYGCCGRSRPERDSAGTGQSHACGHQPDGCGDAGDGMGDTRGAGSAEQRWRRDESSRLATASGADAWADCIWLPCTDGKARPVVAIVQCVADGVRAAMVPCGAQGEAQHETEEVDGQTSDSVCPESVPAMQRADGTEAVSRHAGVSTELHATALLRPTVHGEMAGGSHQASIGAEQPQAISKSRATGVCVVSVVGETPRPSHRREPTKQHTSEPPDVVRGLSSAGAFAALRRDDTTTQALRVLRETCPESRMLLDAQYAPTEVWRSLDDEGKARLVMALGACGFVTAPMSPLSIGEANRVGRLRGYGNAIVPQTAAEVLRAWQAVMR